MKFSFNQALQGLAGNMSEVDNKKLQKKYADYLLDEEIVESGYQLIRDTVMFTNIRLLFIDHQGVTDNKVSFKSIFLTQIVNVEIETAGFGIDDSELTITYLENVYLKPREEKLLQLKFEFPKKTDLSPLYKRLLKIALTNREQMND